MPFSSLADPARWAEQTFGSAVLGDKRRPARAVQLGAALVANPSASLPRQLPTAAALEATYDLLHQPDVTHSGVLQPHWTQTRAAAGEHPVVLLVGDQTILDYSHHPTTTGLGPVGDGRGRGYLVHTVLAVTPAPRTVVGLAHQIPYVPVPTRKAETLRQEQARRRQSDLWIEAVEAIGAPPPATRWVHVGDRASDIFRFMVACRQHSCDFLVRAMRNRRVQPDPADEEQAPVLFDLIESWQPREERTLALPARHARRAREARVGITWEPLRLLVPRQEPADGPLDVWVVRVWERDDPEDGGNPIHWVLLTSVPVRTATEAWERVAWYTGRWTVEDFHQCLKTGCALEKRNLGDQPALERLLAFCSPVAVHLLQLRDAARQEPERHAQEVVDPSLVRVVAALTTQSAETMTVQEFWYAVARRGGYLGRTRDGPPGWKTLWLGWYDLHRILEGVRLAPLLQN